MWREPGASAAPRLVGEVMVTVMTNEVVATVMTNEVMATVVIKFIPGRPGQSPGRQGRAPRR